LVARLSDYVLASKKDSHWDVGPASDPHIRCDTPPPGATALRGRGFAAPDVG
jgi:hypothetical protein